METKNKNTILNVAKLMIGSGVLIVLFFIYSGLGGVKDEMTNLKTSQDTLKTEVKTLKKEYKIHNFNDSTFQHTILPIIKNNTEVISKNLK
jgi:hypothetical protein